ncbi:TPA: hypothetical protein ACMDRZ_003234 [Vibrio cholerae]|uniref:hypothetical protein n=1 Tax=Vibrio cholerae TaxID=666 RepID=UPI001581F8DC|nr:hypothetical protein [Vibrio cholerae]QKU65510.1 hypothetical protein HPY17_19510 [Vibrio cholerae]
MKKHQYQIRDFRIEINLSIVFILLSIGTSDFEYLIVTGIMMLIAASKIIAIKRLDDNIDKHWNEEFIIEQYKLTPSSTKIINESFEKGVLKRIFKTQNGRYGIFTLTTQPLICNVELIREEEAKKALLKAGKDIYVKEFGELEEA